MNREQALPYVSVIIDDALNIQEVIQAGHNVIDPNAVLVGWQCGFEPMFVAVISYLPNVTLDKDEAEDIAADYLNEIGWFADNGAGDPSCPMYIEPDYIIGGK